MSSLSLSVLSLVSAALATYSNSTAPVNFVTGTYPELIEVGTYAKCPSLNFSFKNHGSYPPASASVVSAYQVDENDYEITLQFSAQYCPPLSNLDQAAIIGVNSPESSVYYLHDSNQKISNIADSCDWSARFVVTGAETDGVVCVPNFQIHYSWFSGLASSSYASSFKYNSAYEYAMNCVHDNNNNAQSDFSQYCFAVDSVPESSSSVASSAIESLSSSVVSSAIESLSSSSSSAIATVAPSTISVPTVEPTTSSFIDIPSYVNSSIPSTTFSSSLTTITTSASGNKKLAELYYQCGGINWTGATACVEGAVCSSMNPFYYQCVAGPTPTTTPTTTKATTKYTTSNTAIPTTTALLYGQCGGNNWTGATVCVEGAVCSSMNDWYYQCVAGPTPTTTKHTTSNTAIPTTFAPLYGQCGGNNWTGATACSQGVCSSMNDFYYQCVMTAY